MTDLNSELDKMVENKRRKNETRTMDKEMQMRVLYP